MANFVLTPEQREDLRRLTQKANRRIKQARRKYEAQGLEVLPREVVGNKQHPNQWETKTNPYSRSTKFGSKREFQQHMKELRQFENVRPTFSQYSKVQGAKTIQAVKTATGLDELPEELTTKIEKMDSAQLSKFWDTFSDKASRMGMAYSSDQAIQDTIDEIFPEDIANTVGD